MNLISFTNEFFIPCNRFSFGTFSSLMQIVLQLFSFIFNKQAL